MMVEIETIPGLRLCRRTVRKGCAFPALSLEVFGEAVPRQLDGGAASSEEKVVTERQSLSALCGGQAAVLSFLLAISSFTAVAQSPTPGPQELQMPAVATDFRPTQKPLPELTRVGVDMDLQRPLSMREALALALANNKDIEVARQNVRISEFDLKSAQGVYDPRISSTSYYERSKSPISSFLSGGSNGAVTQSDYTGTARLEGLTPAFGGNYHLDFSSIRLTSNNQFTALNPQYPTALTFTYTQPLFRGLRFDSSRRSIEIAKKNLSLTDAQFRQRAIETITSVQRAYWDLVFALRNLQVQREAVRDARTQL